MKLAPVQLPPRRLFLVAAAAGAMVLIAALLVIFRFDPAQHTFYPKCLLHSLTGWSCAGCGSLRATHHLLHGNFMAALRCNPLLVVATSLPVVLLGCWLRGETPTQFFQRFGARPVMAWALLGVVLLFTVLRNLPFAAFAWMKP